MGRIGEHEKEIVIEPLEEPIPQKEPIKKPQTVEVEEPEKIQVEV